MVSVERSWKLNFLHHSIKDAAFCTIQFTFSFTNLIHNKRSFSFKDLSDIFIALSLNLILLEITNVF